MSNLPTFWIKLPSRPLSPCPRPTGRVAMGVCSLLTEMTGGILWVRDSAFSVLPRIQLYARQPAYTFRVRAQSESSRTQYSAGPCRALFARQTSDRAVPSERTGLQSRIRHSSAARATTWRKQLIDLVQYRRGHGWSLCFVGSLSFVAET